MNDSHVAVLASEREYWGASARLYQHYNDDEYRLIVSLLSSKRGRLDGVRVLEVGCGVGLWTHNLAELGAKVYPFDLSVAMVKCAQALAAPSQVQGCMADMLALPYSNASFDVVFGSMVLHHARDHGGVGREVARVLKPGGAAVFHENSAQNPFLRLARQTLVGRFGIPRNSSPFEHPLRSEEIDNFSAAFAHRSIHIGRMVFFQLAVKYLAKKETGAVFRLAQALDHFIYRFIPPLRPFSYYQVLEFRVSPRFYEST